jgi:hypothetical protein
MRDTSRNESADSEPNLASPLCHESQHGGSISAEGFESQVGMKRGNERLDRGLTVSYCICCQVNQLIRNTFLSRVSLSFNGREAPSFSLPGSTEGARVLVHSCLVPALGHNCKPKLRSPGCDNLAYSMTESLWIDQRIRCDRQNH